jgi:ribosomal-protein-alanine N-acetyltransferase
LPHYIRLMGQGDVSQVTEIDREAFPTMLPPANFRRELNSPLAHYIVACGKEGKAAPTGTELNKNGEQLVTGFAGFWLMAGEAHIVNLAVRHSHRRQGIGELLLICLVELAMEMEASLITLEVRASNTSARRLYSKYGFTTRGLRKRYYSDNREDAVIMTADDINSSPYRIRLKQLKKAHSEKWGTPLYQIVS